MVQIKRKVTIKKKIAQEEVPFVNPDVTSNPTSTSTTKGNSSIGKWIIGAVVVLGVCCGAYFLINGSNSTKSTPNDNTVTVTKQPGNTSATDSLAEETKVENETSAEETTTQDGTNAVKQTPKQEAPKAQDAPVATEKPAVVEQPDAKVPSVNVSSSIEENAKRVIRGDFGNGQERKDRLGAEYAEIQAKVNEIMLH